MNYLPRNRARQKTLRKIGILAVILIAGAFVFSLINGVLIAAFSPLWRAENRVSQSVAKAFENFSSRQALIAENAELKEKLRSLELRLQSLGSLDSQSELSALAGRANQAGIPAGVLTRPPQSAYDVLVADAGESHGVSAGARVFLSEGPEIGTVVEVFSKSSRIKLYTSSGESTHAVLERHLVPVVLEGAGAGNFQIIIPRETQVEVGDRILSSGLDANLMAVVRDIKVEQTDSFKKVLAQSPANIFGITRVLIKP